LFQSPNYKRHDEIGWNYRLSEFLAAIAFAQLERLDELVGMRVKAAKLFMDVMISECDYLIPQKTPDGYTNSYYTLGVKYLGEEKIGIKWEDFRKAYIEAGGDGFYGAWSVPYLEPVMAERKFVKRYPEIYKNVYYPQGLCPVAELIQPRLMQFKTNYRSIDLAKQKAEILRGVIRRLKK